MELWGLTGGIACGKSTVSRMLAAHGAVIVDADLLARDVVAPGSEGLAELVASFGPSILAADGTLDRKALGVRVFADPEARGRLNRITHPRIAALSAQRTQAAEASGAHVCVYDAPLLVENGLHRGMQQVLVVSCRPDVQLQRLMARDGLDEAAARARVASQMPLEQKRAVATVVLENDGPVQGLQAQVDAFWAAAAPRVAGG